MTHEIGDGTVYADGTGGHSGSDTSQARAERERDSGKKSAREIETLSWLALAAETGLTYAELGRYADWHHGQSSAVLSTLHKGGKVARLTGRRNGAKVYVLPVYAEGSPTEPHGGRAAGKVLAQRINAALEEIGPHMKDSPGTLGRIYRILTGEQS